MCTFERVPVVETDPKTGEITKRYTRRGKKLVDCGKKNCETSVKYQKK